MAQFTAQFITHNQQLGEQAETCESFEDIPFEKWIARKVSGQLVLNFPTYEHQYNFIISCDGKLDYVGNIASTKIQASAEGLESLLLGQSDWMANKAKYAVPLQTIAFIKEATAERNSAILNEFRYKQVADGWGGPLAMLAGVGLLAMAKAAKAKPAKAQVTKHIEETVEVSNGR